MGKTNKHSNTSKKATSVGQKLKSIRLDDEDLTTVNISSPSKGKTSANSHLNEGSKNNGTTKKSSLEKNKQNTVTKSSIKPAPGKHGFGRKLSPTNASNEDSLASGSKGKGTVQNAKETQDTKKKTPIRPPSAPGEEMGRNVKQSSIKDLKQLDTAVVEKFDESEFLEAKKQATSKLHFGVSDEKGDRSKALNGQKSRAEAGGVNGLKSSDKHDASANKTDQKTKDSTQAKADSKTNKKNPVNKSKAAIYATKRQGIEKITFLKSQKKLVSTSHFGEMMLAIDNLLKYVPDEKIEAFALSPHFDAYATAMEEVIKNLSKE